VGTQATLLTGRHRADTRRGLVSRGDSTDHDLERYANVDRYGVLEVHPDPVGVTRTDSPGARPSKVALDLAAVCLRQLLDELNRPPGDRHRRTAATSPGVVNLSADRR
jgi:hypothetical protein